MTILSPLAARISFIALIGCRFLIGVIYTLCIYAIEINSLKNEFIRIKNLVIKRFKNKFKISHSFFMPGMSDLW